MIRLNDKGIRAYTANGGAPSRTHRDWQNRTGRIVKYSRNKSIAYVLWDGNRSLDPVSVDLIEAVLGARVHVDRNDSSIAAPDLNEQIENDPNVKAA